MSILDIAYTKSLSDSHFEWNEWTTIPVFTIDRRTPPVTASLHSPTKTTYQIYEWLHPRMNGRGPIGERRISIFFISGSEQMAPSLLEEFGDVSLRYRVRITQSRHPAIPRPARRWQIGVAIAVPFFMLNKIGRNFIRSDERAAQTGCLSAVRLSQRLAVLSFFRLRQVRKILPPQKLL